MIFVDRIVFRCECGDMHDLKEAGSDRDIIVGIMDEFAKRHKACGQAQLPGMGFSDKRPADRPVATDAPKKSAPKK